MAKIRVIKKNDDYSMDYQVGDILGEHVKDYSREFHLAL